MSYIKKRQTKFMAAVVGMTVMAIAASRQLYLFVVFRNAQGLLDAQGGRYHLWLAIGAVLMACLAGCFMFYFFLGADPANVSADVQTAAVRLDSIPDTPASSQANAGYQQPAVIRVLPLHESGIPYASRST